VLAGLVALSSLTCHGALYIAIKSEGALYLRARGIAVLTWPILFFLTICSLVATYFVRPAVMNNYRAHPIGIVIPIVVFAALAVMIWAALSGKDKVDFFASSFSMPGL